MKRNAALLLGPLSGILIYMVCAMLIVQGMPSTSFVLVTLLG